MNKYILAAAVVVGLGWTALRAGQVMPVPEADSNQPVASADYGGVDYSSSNFNANFTTVGAGKFRVYGVTFSSGSISDFVQFYDTGSWAQAGTGGVSTETFRLYNTAASTGGVNPSGSFMSAGFVAAGSRPIRFRFGLGYKVSNANYQSVIVHFWKEQ